MMAAAHHEGPVATLNAVPDAENATFDAPTTSTAMVSVWLETFTSQTVLASQMDCRRRKGYSKGSCPR
jgi:hypothetical protein